MTADVAAELERPLVESSRAALQGVDALAHYTRAAVAASILERDELWLTHVQALTDVSEVSRGARVVRRRLEDMAKAGAGGPLVAELARGFEAVFDAVFGSAFVFCLSGHDREADADGRLAMWRAYGEDGDGACLVFDKARLLEAGSGALPMIWTAIRYETEGEFEARLDAFFDHLAALAPGPDAAGAVGRCLMAYAMSHKHPAFRDEQEIRLFHVREHGAAAPEGATYGYCHEPRGVRPIFRVDLQAASGARLGVGDMLESVVLGPSDHAPVNRLAMEAVLDARGLCDRPVRLSEIPFRARR